MPSQQSPSCCDLLALPRPKVLGWGSLVVGVRLQRSLWLAGLVVIGALCGAGPVGVAADPTPNEILLAGGIAATPAGVADYLRGWIADEPRKLAIRRLIAELGSGDFQRREQADKKIRQAGPAVILPLREATLGEDLEVKLHAEWLLTDLDSAAEQHRRESLGLAALHWLAANKPADAALLILDIYSDLMSPELLESAAEALWACASPAANDRLRQAIAHGALPLKAAALPALEIAAGDAAEDLLLVCLRDPNSLIQLAAARALLDRRPEAALHTLLDLLRSDDPDMRAQAAWLLQLASGIPTDHDRGLDWLTTVDRWRQWVASPASLCNRLLGASRLQVQRYGLIVAVNFLQDAPHLAAGYGLLTYETDCGGSGSVSGGLLRLDGDHPEGDQRLFFDAKTLLRQPAFPKHFQVIATLGGEKENSGAWHVGLSLGNVRVLFHPDFSGGAFRVERVDNRQVIHHNEEMPFTPAAGTLYQMTVGVVVDADQAATLDVRLAAEANPNESFQRFIHVPAVDIGRLSRVGLERSGRTGGSALFQSLLIRQ